MLQTGLLAAFGALVSFTVRLALTRGFKMIRNKVTLSFACESYDEHAEETYSLTVPLKVGALRLDMGLMDLEEIHCAVRRTLQARAMREARKEKRDA